MQFSTPTRPRGSYARIKFVAYAALVLSIAALVSIASLAVLLTRDLGGQATTATSTSTSTLAPISVSGQLITPPLSLADAPVITAQEPFGQRLTDINLPLNSTQLAVINEGPNSYFETAAQMYLNGSITTAVGTQIAPAPLFTVNGKLAVTYLGAISCIFCGENRWAMALALSRFGTFQNLFFGYSALQDDDVPTLYWAPAHYNSSAAVDWGNFYNGTYVTFLSIEYASPITAGFEMGGLTYFQQQARALNNTIYQAAVNLIIKQNTYEGTPYTIWGKYNPLTADASDFGDSTSIATGSSTSASFASTSAAAATAVPMASMTHDQILASFARPTTAFAWTEYAAADYYVALVCASLGGGLVSSTTAPAICSSPSIATMTSQAEKV